jgi:outer membrane protein TolC
VSFRPRWFCFSSDALLLGRILLVLLLTAPVAIAQESRFSPLSGLARQPRSVFSGGVPQEGAPGGTLRLTLTDAVVRGLEHNLGPLLAAEDVRRARALLAADQGELLPRAYAALRQSSRQINLDAFGFGGSIGGGGATVSSVVGPFDLYDGRVNLQWALFDPAAIARVRRGAATVDAAELTFEDAREVVTLAVADQYLQMLAAERLTASVEAEVETSRTLRQIAVDRKEAGSAAGIEVLRAEVRLQQDRQRLIATRNAQTKQRLDLARMIGLPLGQELEPADTMSEAAPPSPELDAAVEQAWARRRDLAAAESRVEAARAARRAATRERYPSLRIGGDYGVLGREVDTVKETFDLGATIAVPIYDRAVIDSEEIRAEAELRARDAELEDLRAAIYYEVRGALLDLDAARELTDVGRSGLDLARRQLEQARNRFAAGVASNLEVVEAQESLARADETFIASLYLLTVERLRLARALGETGEVLPGLVERAVEERALEEND